jgi:hypothetical protein
MPSLFANDHHHFVIKSLSFLRSRLLEYVAHDADDAKQHIGRVSVGVLRGRLVR